MDQDDYSVQTKKVGKQHNTLPLWGNEATMNLNPLILANIQGSSYFKVHLFKLKTYHEVVDEIYYQVKHLEPWERGSRKTSGQTGMCGGVRGVGAGGIVSTAFCLLYKLYTLRLTRKQVNGLLNHNDSPYIRALGFMYIRFTQPPSDLFDWYEDYFQDEEEIDVKAGGGQNITIGQMAYQFLTKLDWFSTLFPRIPVPMQKMIEKKLEEYCRKNQVNFNQMSRPSGSYARTTTGSVETPEYQESRNGGNSTSLERGREKYSRESYTRPRYNNRIDYRDRERPENKRDERYDKPRSKSKEKSERREKHKKKHKHRSRSRSRERRTKDRTEDERNYRDRDYDRKYR